MRCPQKCDKGSQCYRIAGHPDGYHLTEHGCVCLTPEARTESTQWWTHVAAPEPFTEAAGPPHPGIVSRQPTQSTAKSYSNDEISRMAAYALRAWERT